ncbi:MAG: hypothetical protein AB7L84_14170, partial [Acidimicrobiia bacterium]
AQVGPRQAVQNVALPPEQSQAIDAAWTHLSVQWTAEEVAERLRAAVRGLTVPGNEQTPDDLAIVGGLKQTLMVGAKGLEPLTSAV